MTELELRRLVSAVHAGRMPRRVFLDRMLAMGLSVPLAAAMLGASGVAHAQAAGGYKPSRRGGGGALKLLFWQGATYLNPHFANGSKDSEASSVFYESLLRTDADGNHVPVLAAEVPTPAPDGKSVLWKLKRGVQWHDGKPFTADDVIFNWQYSIDPAAATWTRGLYENIRNIEKIDSHSLRVVYDKPMPDWRLWVTQLVPKHVFSAYMGAKAREAPANLKPVGTGPYRIVEFRPGDLVVGELNPNYHQPNRPYFDRIEIKGGGDATSAARAVLQTGEFDFAWNLLVEEEVLKRMETGGKGRVLLAAGGTTEFIQVNSSDPWTEVDGERSSPKSRHPIFSDPQVRKALMLLIDRRSIQQHVFGRAGVISPNYLNNPVRYNSKGTADEYNPDKAGALLDAAGWKKGADGVREKGGRKFKLVYQTSANSLRQKVQAIVKQSFARAGIEVELKAVSATVFFSSDYGNPDTAGKFWADLQMYAFTRGADPGRYMQNYLSTQASSKANKWLGLNYTRYQNAEYDTLNDLAENELDPIKRAALYIRMNDMVCNEGQVLPLVYRPGMHAARSGLVAPVTAWDNVLSALSDWYREA